MLITHGARMWCLLCLALAIAACSGGGGGDEAPQVPWGRLRSSVNNAAFASGTLTENRGVRTAVLTLGPDVQRPGIDGVPVTVGGITGSTPIIGINELIYLGTTAGLLVTNKDATRVRVFDDCDTVPVGRVSGTAAINTNNDVVFGDDNGRIFAFNDDGTTFECLWVFEIPTAGAVVSSPLILSDGFDRTLVSAYVGIGSGHLQALNNFGTPQWRFPGDSSAFPAPLTSSASSDGVSFHITAPDGFLYSLDRAGRLQHQARISLAINDTNLLPSPISATSIYAVGVGGRCGDTIAGCLEQSECSDTTCGELGDVGVLTALTPLDEVRWRFATDFPIAGSASFAIQAIDEPAAPLATPTPPVTPPVPDDSTPTPTPTRLAIVLQGVIYVVDTEGTVYGVKDVSGDLFVARPGVATATATPTFIPGEDTPTPAPTPIEPDSKPAKAQLLSPVTVTSSPVLSADLFVVFGTDGGELYAMRLDFDRTIPCQDCAVADRQWEQAPLVNNEFGGGKVPLDTHNPVVSSPIIDSDGTIYVTAGDVSTGAGTLYAVGSQP